MTLRCSWTLLGGRRGSCTVGRGGSRGCPLLRSLLVRGVLMVTVELVGTKMILIVCGWK